MKESLEKKKNKNLKKGISLIVLVITIIVIVILAVAVILSMANNNPIDNANKASFQNNVKTMQEELELTKASNYANSKGERYTDEKGNLTINSLNESEGKFDIMDGNLVYIKNKVSDSEKEWCEEFGLESAYLLEDGKNGVTISNDTLSTDWNGTVPDDVGENIIIPEGVEKIGTSAFQSCKSLKSVKLPKSLEDTGYLGFYDCSNLTNITLPDGLKLINGGCFGGCTNLKEITIPDTVTEIFTQPFSTDRNLTIYISKATFDKITEDWPESHKNFDEVFGEVKQVIFK